MSIETMLSIDSLLKLSPNEILFGQDNDGTNHDEIEPRDFSPDDPDLLIWRFQSEAAYNSQHRSTS